jgi:two-component system, response regulator FlrC
VEHAGANFFRLREAARRAAHASGARKMTYRDKSVASVVKLAEQVTGNLVGRTVAEVERELILETLKHCLGNRTHAAEILGISIRTLRNKLSEYAADGAPIPPPNGGGEPMRGAA